MFNNAPSYEMKIQHEHYAAELIKSYYVVVDGKKIARPAKNILDRGKEDADGRKIVKYSITQGSYGNDLGPGFMGLLLAEDSKRNLKREWLIFTIHSADQFALLDERMVYASWTFYKLPRPLIYHEGTKFVDQFGPKINGGIIKSIELKDESITMQIETNGASHTLEVLNKDRRLSPTTDLSTVARPTGISGDDLKKAKWKPRAAFSSGHRMSEYVIFMEENGEIYV